MDNGLTLTREQVERVSGALWRCEDEAQIALTDAEWDSGAMADGEARAAARAGHAELKSLVHEFLGHANGEEDGE